MSNRTDDLEPQTRAMCLQLLHDAEDLGHDLGLSWTLRTDAEQNHMHAKGRTLAGEPCHHSDGRRPVGTCAQHPLGATVTRAKAGQSPHNEIVDGKACAFDIYFKGAVAYPPESDPRWAELGALGESLGLSWGGPRGKGDRFTFDRPHFEHPKWKEMRATVSGETG